MVRGVCMGACGIIYAGVHAHGRRCVVTCERATCVESTIDQHDTQAISCRPPERNATRASQA